MNHEIIDRLYLIELLNNKTDIKLHINDVKKYKKFIKLCHSLSIFWNGDQPPVYKEYVFVTTHQKGYKLTFTSSSTTGVEFFDNHKARLVKL